MSGLSALVRESGVEAELVGFPPMPLLEFRQTNEKRRDAFGTAFYGETLRRGVFFHPTHVWFLSLSHSEADVDRTLEVSREAMKVAKEKTKR